MSTIRHAEDLNGPAEAATATQVVELAPNDEFDLRIAAVRKRIGQADVRMIAYNGSIPGPTMKVRQGSQVVVNIDNAADMPTAVHWHGLRLDNRYDGTHHVQDPISVGERFSAVLSFPDPGIYWYHPHIRTDYGLEMGLYGTILVEPTQPDYWPPASRELVLTLDDLLLENGQIAPFDPNGPNYVAMGRFGDVLLVNGETDYTISARHREVVRFYLVNTANTRVFRVALPGARMKLVGGDSGRVEREALMDEVILAPSERAVIDVLFDDHGDFTLEHRTPRKTYGLASIAVQHEVDDTAAADAFEGLRTNADMTAERARVQPYLLAPPDKSLAFIAEMNMPEPEAGSMYACPMHPDVVSDSAGSCPKCGMKLVPTSTAGSTSGVHHGGGAVHWLHMAAVAWRRVGARLRHLQHGSGRQRYHRDVAHQVVRTDEHSAEHRHHGDAAGDGIGATAGVEWEDDMVDVNRMTTSANMRWKLIDRDTGAENTDIDWRFKVGDRVKIRLLNEMAGDHPMHHPFHVHGAGRFLVLSRRDVVEPNLVWKDTVLVRTGETVDILLDVTHPGTWMAHCHIAEHHENNMMFSFDVSP